LRFNRHPQIEKLSWLDYLPEMESSNVFGEERREKNEDLGLRVLYFIFPTFFNHNWSVTTHKKMLTLSA
jgi:hypothetical protein